MVTLHDTRFVECRWWNDGGSVTTQVVKSRTVRASGDVGCGLYGSLAAAVTLLLTQLFLFWFIEHITVVGSTSVLSADCSGSPSTSLLSADRAMILWSAPTCAFSVLMCGAQRRTCAFNALMCGAQRRTCAFSSLICGAQHRTCAFSVLMCGAQRRTCAFSSLMCGAQRRTCAFSPLMCGAQRRTCAFSSLMCGAQRRLSASDLWQTQSSVSDVVIMMRIIVENNDNERISRAPFHVKHAYLR